MQLKKMSTYLSELQSFQVQNDAVDEIVTKDGQKLQFISSSRVAVKRPNAVRSDRLGAITDAILRYDGKTISVYGKRTGYYATAPAAPTIDVALDEARARLGLEMPAGDLIVSNPYKELMNGVVSGRYIGIEPIDGVPCHHLAMRAKDVDWQIWIQDGPQPLPRRYVITSKTVHGQPQFSVALSKWEPNAKLADDLFAFQPPAGSTRIAFALPKGAQQRTKGH